MGGLHPAGLFGGLIGAGLGWLNAQVIGGYVAARLTALDRSATPAEREGFEKRIALMKTLIRLVLTGGTAAIGYAFGSSLGG